ncbi:SRPBCC domain-containing protein [Plantactinospora sp. GCM10030261]|uniref:SRPBCC family protein n=1 Tax=Plantactinospora sp. GCM10030261 TaxID=3273420 RepID=UPI00361C66B2
MSELRVTRHLPAPKERVWAAWTDPALLAAWFWPQRFATTASVDPRVGGAYRIEGPGGGISVGGGYRSVDPPQRLEFDWRFDGDAERTRVTVTLSPTDGGTDLAITHTGFSDDADRDNNVLGWQSCLDRLAAWLAAQPASPD